MGLGIKVCAAPHHCYVTNVKCYSSNSSAASFGSVALRSKKPTIPEINEPRIIPSLASLSTDAASGPLNERVAMNRETVKPIPPSIETDASIFHVEWRGIRANPHLIVAHENRNIPVNLPINKPPIMASANIVIHMIKVRNGCMTSTFDKAHDFLIYLTILIYHIIFIL